MNELAKVSRFEVIDHRENGSGRALVIRGSSLKVETSMQDDDRTLKMFISDTQAQTPISKAQVNQLYAYNLLRESLEGEDEKMANIIHSLGEYIKQDG